MFVDRIRQLEHARAVLEFQHGVLYPRSLANLANVHSQYLDEIDDATSDALTAAVFATFFMTRADALVWSADAALLDDLRRLPAVTIGRVTSEDQLVVGRGAIDTTSDVVASTPRLGAPSADERDVLRDSWLRSPSMFMDGEWLAALAHAQATFIWATTHEDVSPEHRNRCARLVLHAFDALLATAFVVDPARLPADVAFIDRACSDPSINQALLAYVDEQLSARRAALTRSGR